MAVHYLEFERPIADLEAKIEELSKLSETAGSGAFEPPHATRNTNIKRASRASSMSRGTTHARPSQPLRFASLRARS